MAVCLVRCLSVVMVICAAVHLVEPGLYSADTPIIELDTETFYESVRGSEFTWVVEFYASWCGHCQEFAPIYNLFSREVKDWRGFRVAAVDCAREINRVVCYAEDVWTYPEVKFYAYNSSLYDRGILYNGTSGASAMMRESINFITQQQEEGQELPGVPRLTPYDHVSAIDATEKNATYVLVLNRNLAETKLAQVVIMDLSDIHPEVKVAWMLSGRSGLRVTGSSRPALYRLNADRSLEPLRFNRSRAGIEEAIRRNAFDQPQPTTSMSTTTAMTTVPTTARLAVSQNVHMKDLVSSLYYQLFMEVSMVPVIQNQSLEALKTHMKILTEYHPGPPHAVRFLNRVNQWLKEEEGPLTGQQWLDQIRSFQSDRAFIPEEAVYTGCAGSQEKFRGCPCALWQTFHVLTVSAYLRHRRDPKFDPKEVPVAMREYIRHFFKCHSCADHFVRMAASIDDNILSRSDGMLWLWAAHNKVNNRLHGKPSEDPEHPKAQFPTHLACPVCRGEPNSLSPFDTHIRWNTPRVKRHLIVFYRKKNIIQDA